MPRLALINTMTLSLRRCNYYLVRASAVVNQKDNVQMKISILQVHNMGVSLDVVGDIITVRGTTGQCTG